MKNIASKKWDGTASGYDALTEWAEKTGSPCIFSYDQATRRVTVHTGDNMVFEIKPGDIVGYDDGYFFPHPTENN